MSVKIKKKRKKWPWIVGGVLLVVLIGGVGVYSQTSKMPRQGTQNVNTTVLKLKSLEESISASGTLASGSSVNVTSSLNTEIEKVNVKVGDKVTKGEVLAVFDKTDLQKAVTEASQSYSIALKQFNLKVSQAKRTVTSAKKTVTLIKANLKSAKAAYAVAEGDAVGSANYNSRYAAAAQKDQTTISLIQELSSANNSLTNAKDNYDNTVANNTTLNAKSELKTAKSNLANATIKAPVSGTLSEVNASVGNSPSSSNGNTSSDSSTTGSSSSSSNSSSNSSSSLFTIQKNNKFIVEASVADYDVIKLKVGTEVKITIDSTNDTYKGEITTISPIANSSGNYDITVKVTNSSGKDLRVGMSATVKITLNKKDNIYVVPVDAIVEKNDKKYVVALDNSDTKAMKQNYIEVTTGMETDYYVEISGTGLKAGLSVLNDPLNKTTTTTNQTSSNPGMGFPGGGGPGGM